MTQEKPLISIIVRTKDRPKMLQRALRSIAAQTYRPLEVVLVNDGGCDLDADEITNILGDIQLKYLRLEKNMGRAHAGNVGLRNANGFYIGFLDDDDEFYPEHIATLEAFLEQSDYKVAYTDVEMVFTDFEAEGKTIVDVDKKILSRDFSYRDLLLGNYIPFNTILFPKDILTSAGYIDEGYEIYEDWDLLIRVAEHHPFYHIKKVTAQYNQWSRDLQINQKDVFQMKASHLKVIEKYREKITPSALYDLQLEKEKALAEARHLSIRLAELRDHLQQTEGLLNEKTRQFLEKNEQWEKTSLDLDQVLREKRTIEETLKTKKQPIAGLEEELKTKEQLIAGLEEELRAKDNRIRQADETLARVLNTTGWKMLEKLRNMRENALPSGSRRRKFLDLCLKSGRVIKREGMLGFLLKAKKKVRSDYLEAGFNPGSHDVYEEWIAKNEIRDRDSIQTEIEEFVYRPRISIITPVYNVEPIWLNKCVESVMNQFYDNWELCLYDDASTNKETIRCLKKLQGRDPRIKVYFGKQNEGISGTSNRALKTATGEFIALLDNDDELSPDALYENVKLLNIFSDTDVIYSDEDKVSEQADGTSKRFDPFFKPDWSPQLLFACMYTGHLSLYRKSLVTELGGFRSEYDFSQDYDLALRVTEKTARIRHIQKILYHWRALPASAAGGGKAFARTSNIEALKSAVKRRGHDAEVLEYPFANRVKFVLKKYPLVSIIIPTDSEKNIFSCIGLLLKNTAYPCFEIVVVTNSILGEQLANRYQGEAQIRICFFDKPFNFSLKCNEGASFAKGEYLLFFNDDVEALDPTWLDDMIGVFGKGSVGGVSPKLFYENDTIQYAGMVTGVRDLVGTAFHCQPKDSGFYFNMIQSERNVSLLSGACLLMPKGLFGEVGGFDAVNTPIMHSDLDLCFKILEKGYELIYTPFASLRHIGHLALGEAERTGACIKPDKADLFMLKKWGHYLGDDPYYTGRMRELLYQNGDLEYQLIASEQPEQTLAARNILMISHDLSLSGAPLLLFQLACNLRNRGYFISIISPCHGELEDSYRKENIPVMIDSTISSSPLEGTIKFASNFDLIVANTIIMWKSIHVAHELGIPSLWLIHESQAGKALADSDARIGRALKLADDVVFACSAQSSLYEQHSNDNFRVMSYGARQIEWSATGHSADVKPVAGKKFLLLQIGSIEHRKGQDVLLKAVSMLPGSIADTIEVQIIGRQLNTEEHINYFRRIQKAAGLSRNIRLLGQVPHNRIGEFIVNADVFISASRDEVFPLTVLEAMSAGKAIISTNVGGVSVMIRNNEDGIIIDSEDSRGLADVIINLYENRQELKRLGDNARKRFEENFTIDKFTDRFLSVATKRLGDRNITHL